MRLDDAADDAPRPLATPPSPMLLTRNVPFVRFVAPVWLLAPVSTTVPVPPLTKLVAPPLSTMVESIRSEEHTSELQSLMRISYAVFCLKKNTHQHGGNDLPRRHITDDPTPITAALKSN